MWHPTRHRDNGGVVFALARRQVQTHMDKRSLLFSELGDSRAK